MLFTELDRGLSVSNNDQNKRKYKEENKNSGDCTVATPPRQLHYSNNLSKNAGTISRNNKTLPHYSSSLRMHSAKGFVLS